MAKVSFDPLIKWFTGTIGKLVYRRSHNGKISVYELPDMTRVKWSRAQKDHRQHFGESSIYASAAIADPDIRAAYVQMAIDRGRNPRRPFDTAKSDYLHGGSDLLWQKHMGDREKPQNWNIENYPWYVTDRTKRRKRR